MARDKTGGRDPAPGQEQHDREEQYGGFGAENDDGQPSERARGPEAPGRVYRENRDEHAHQDTRNSPGQGSRGHQDESGIDGAGEPGDTRAGRESGEAGDWSHRTFGQADFGQGTWGGSGAARTGAAADAETAGGGTGEGMHGQPNHGEGEEGFSNFNQRGAGGQQSGTGRRKKRT